ncbi:hypothetical protein [Halorubrum trueperi]|uniref:Uncharacterized protein n=1 Tax=Halorubrum trueperi TaxID=2004704 RepID=A0ABD5UG44_9EURY
MSDFEEFLNQNNSEELSVDGENSEIDDSKFWNQLYRQAISNFERALEEAQTLRAESIEMLKIILLLGSFYVAIFQFGSNQFSMTTEPTWIFLPFISLLVSAIIFIHGYFTLSSITFGPNSQHPRKAIRDEFDASEYQKVMMIVYFEWADDNFDLIRKGQKRFTIALGGLFASLGMVAVVFLYL